MILRIVNEESLVTSFVREGTSEKGKVTGEYEVRIHSHHLLIPYYGSIVFTGGIGRILIPC